MTMRITSNMIQRQVLGALQRGGEAQFGAQKALSSGLRFEHAREDPRAAATVLAQQTRLSELQGQLQGADVIESRLANAESRLGGLTDVLQAFRETLVQGQNATLNAEDRAILAAELRGLSETYVGLANSRDVEGRPLFSGTGDALPFAGAPGSYVLNPPLAPAQVQLGSAGVFNLNVDAQALFVDAAGTTDMAAVFESLAVEVEANPTDDVGRAARRDALDQGILEIDAAIDKVVGLRSRLGNDLNRLDSFRDSASLRQIELQSDISRLQDADVAEEATRLAQESASLEAARAVFQRLSQQSLFNYLR
nr:hypothetical protein [Oceanococcus sp. HetDA_MAG_MS8]